MKFHYYPEKSMTCLKDHAASLEDGKVIFEQGTRYVDQKSDEPEQYFAIGWIKGKLFTVVFEFRGIEEDPVIHLITLWKSTEQEERLYVENNI